MLLLNVTFLLDLKISVWQGLVAHFLVETFLSGPGQKPYYAEDAKLLFNP